MTSEDTAPKCVYPGCVFCILNARKNPPPAKLYTV